MLGITDRAMEMLEAYLEEKHAAQNACVRLVLSSEGGGELELDKPLATDRTYAQSGRPVLVLDKSIARTFADLTLDYTDGDYCWRHYGAEYL